MSKNKLVGYFLAGYPTIDKNLQLIGRCDEAGVDIFEIGYPTGEPKFDGDIIQSAHEEVMKNGMPNLEYWQQLRQKTDKPIWIMAYRKNFVDNGAYAAFAQMHLADAFVLPDCDDDTRAQLQKDLSGFGVQVLGFVNLETPEDQFRKTLSLHNIIYVQLYVGKTGMPGITADPTIALRMAQDFPKVKLYAGFGINTPEQTRRLISQGFEGVIVGTALIKAMQQSSQKLIKLISSLEKAAYSA